MSILNIPSELVELRQSILDFIEREVKPVETKYAQELQENGFIENAEEERKKIRKRSAELGFYTLHMPEDCGGSGLSYLGQVLMAEAVSQAGSFLASRGGVLASVEGPTPVLQAATPEQRTKYLEPLMKADREMCFALTEPGAGSDATRIKTRAERKGDRYLINGTKHFITHGAQADFALVFAVTDAEKRARGGITAFLVDATTPGYQVARIQRTASSVDRPAELVFNDVEVGPEQILGQEGYGFGSAMAWINGGRLGIAAQAVGYAQLLIDKMLDYAKSRVAFGSAISSYQYVQGMIVDSLNEMEQARLFVYKKADEIDGGADGRREAAQAKVVATEMVGRVADRAIQVYGGNGFMTEMGIERYWREVRAMRLYEGTSEILRNNIARTLGM